MPIKARKLVCIIIGVNKLAKQAVRIRRDIFVRAFTHSFSLLRRLEMNSVRIALMRDGIFSIRVTAKIIIAVWVIRLRLHHVGTKALLLAPEAVYGVVDAGEQGAGDAVPHAADG